MVNIKKAKKKEYLKQYYLDNKENLKQYDKQYYLDNREKISGQKKEYYLDNKEKILESSKEYHLNNRGKILKQKKEYYLDNREKLLGRQKQYNLENKPKRNAYVSNKRKTDLAFALTDNLRTRLKQALNGKNKSKSTLKLLGCTVKYLIQHLEKQFQPGMNWENRHLFHIDHIRPCSSFDLTDPKQQSECFNYKNLQPLWAQDNMVKGAKW